MPFYFLLFTFFLTSIACYPTRQLPFVRTWESDPFARLTWRFPTHNVSAKDWDGMIAPFETGPVWVDGETVYVGYADKRFLAALDRGTGHPRWISLEGHPIEAAPSVANGVLFVGTVDGWVKALDTRTGDMLWEYEDRKEFTTTPVPAGSWLVVAASDDTVIGLDIARGTPLWRYEPGYTADLAYRRTAAPVIYGRRVYYTNAKGDMVTLDAESGEILETVDLYDALQPLSDLNLSPVFTEAFVLLATREGLYGFDTLKERWERWSEAGGTQRPWVTPDDAYLATRSGRVVRFDLTHRELMWDTKVGDDYLTPPVFYKDIYILVGSWGGGLYVLHKNSGAILHRIVPEIRVAAPIVAEGSNIYIRSSAGTVHALKFIPPLS